MPEFQLNFQEIQFTVQIVVDHSLRFEEGKVWEIYGTFLEEAAAIFLTNPCAGGNVRSWVKQKQKGIQLIKHHPASWCVISIEFTNLGITQPIILIHVGKLLVFISIKF